MDDLGFPRTYETIAMVKRVWCHWHQTNTVFAILADSNIKTGLICCTKIINCDTKNWITLWYVCDDVESTILIVGTIKLRTFPIMIFAYASSNMLYFVILQPHSRVNTFACITIINIALAQRHILIYNPSVIPVLCDACWNNDRLRDNVTYAPWHIMHEICLAFGEPYKYPWHDWTAFTIAILKLGPSQWFAAREVVIGDHTLICLWRANQSFYKFK